MVPDVRTTSYCGRPVVKARSSNPEHHLHLLEAQNLAELHRRRCRPHQRLRGVFGCRLMDPLVTLVQLAPQTRNVHHRTLLIYVVAGHLAIMPHR